MADLALTWFAARLEQTLPAAERVRAYGAAAGVWQGLVPASYALCLDGNENTWCSAVRS